MCVASRLVRIYVREPAYMRVIADVYACSTCENFPEPSCHGTWNVLDYPHLVLLSAHSSCSFDTLKSAHTPPRDGPTARVQRGIDYCALANVSWYEALEAVAHPNILPNDRTVSSEFHYLLVVLLYPNQTRDTNLSLSGLQLRSPNPRRSTSSHPPPQSPRRSPLQRSHSPLCRTSPSPHLAQLYRQMVG